MKINVLGGQCSMGCMYAEGPISLCLCACGGATHGMATNKTQAAVKCSPASEKRCKEGNESGACQCACGGVNHGVYQTIPNFGEIKITMYA